MTQGFSYWEQSSFLSGYDVLIVGSGIVGLSTALHLKISQPKLKIGVLEAGFLPSGASTKNAGFACFGSISEGLDKLESMSEDEFLQVVEMRWKGLAKLRKNLGDDALDFKQWNGYEIFRKEDAVFSALCVEKIDYFNHLLKPIIGKSDIYSVDRSKLAEFELGGIDTLIKNKYEAQIDTGKMMTAFLYKVQGLGVSVFNTCSVKKIHRNSTEITLETNQGNFSTKRVILTTNAFTSGFYPQLNVEPGRGQVLITEPIDGLKIKGTFHYDRGYYYFRNINNRILLGGGRNLDFETERTTQAGITDIVQNSLEKMLHEVIIPNRKVKIEQRWSGVMGFGDQLKPIIQELEPDIFCGVRCNGMGVAIGSLVGEQVADLALNSF
ncbi:MAG: FAD-binding oxidoreductase [Daejeonella sp.]